MGTYLLKELKIENTITDATKYENLDKKYFL